MAGRIAYYGGIVTNGLVLNLDAAKRDSYPGTGTIWNDISGFRNNGTLTNGPTFNSDNGGSIVFDGVDDFVTSTAISVTNWTVECWFKSNSVGGNFKGIFEFAFNNNGRSGIGINLNGYPLISYPTGLFRVSSTQAVDNNQWYCLVGVYNVTSQNLYVNGNLQTLGSNSSAAPASFTNVIRIGDFTIPGYYLNGSIASVRFYNRALSATEILQNYNALKSRYL
jgi:hypothetical protein